MLLAPRTDSSQFGRKLGRVNRNVVGVPLPPATPDSGRTAAMRLRTGTADARCHRARIEEIHASCKETTRPFGES